MKVIGAAVVATAGYILLALPVSQTITETDIAAIQQLPVEPMCGQMRGFEAEKACVAAIQAAVQVLGSKRCAARSDVIEPLEFIERGYGCCFDRSRFIEKALRF